MIYKLFLKTTTEALASPWLLFGNNFFIIYILTLVLLFIFQYQTKKNPLAFVFLIIHYFITFGVVAIIYKLGYGYDPFLHRAAESHILEFGAILPKTPFYLGQYITVVLTNLISHLPLKLIDIWLVPILSAITLPFSAYFGSKYGLKLKDNWARITALLTLLYPLNTMYVTTPHNLANLLLLNLILISPAIYQNRSLIVPSTILGIFAFIAQPLSGFFALWLLAGIVILDVAKKKSTALIYIYTIAGIMAIPFLFLIYWSLNKISIPTLSTISNNINNFPDLFLLAPYYFINQQVSWILDFVYLSRIFIPILIVAVSIFAFYKLKENKFKIYFLLPIIILVNIFFIITWLIHPDLDPKEQLQYAERLRHILIFFIIPFSSFGIIYLLKKIRKKTILIFSFIFISLILTATWYLTYPQRNPKVHFPGLNVTQADFDASKLIHDENTDSNYIVLSTILTSAASIEQFGFTTYFDTNLGQFFYYSIPSGSPLYQAYLKMLYEEQSQETMQEVMDLTKTDKAYFVINSYWHDFANIVEGAKKTADSWQEVDGGNIWVFRYGTLYPERSETE
ncbi:hypothetical protein KJ641_03400 [Patescibacteria group bacterium]|nr:hypothetical protein [Patescibacteria group bacterium]